MPHHPNQPIHHAPARRIPGSVALLIWAWLTLLLFAAAAVAEPFQPTSDGVVLEQLPQQPALARGTIGRLAAQLVADPQDLNLAVALARQYMQLGRAAADPRYYGYAEAALAPWWTLARPPRDVAVLRAVARQFQHDFDGALGDLAYVLQTDPAHPQALLSRAVIQQVQGHYAAALRTCARLPRQAPPLVVTACAAGAASLSGDAAASYDALSRRLDEQPDAAPELRQWALTILAEIAERAGDTTASERHFRAALALDAHSGYLLGAYADLLLDAGRYDDVRTLLRDDVRSDPLLLRLALAEAASGSHHWAATPPPPPPPPGGGPPPTSPPWSRALPPAAGAATRDTCARRRVSRWNCCGARTKPSGSPLITGGPSASRGMPGWSSKPRWPPAPRQPPDRSSSPCAGPGWKTPASRR